MVKANRLVVTTELNKKSTTFKVVLFYFNNLKDSSIFKIQSPNP